MHPTAAFAWTDESAMLAALADYGWARLFAMTPAGPRVAHVPVLVDAANRTVRFHLANSNALAATVEAGPLLLLGEGPHAYISASWYPDRAVNVPTWNYVAIECEGRATRLDRAGLIGLLDDLVAHHEAIAEGNWQRAEMAEPRFEAMVDAITGYSLAIETMRGTGKLSQNKSAADRAALAAGVDASGNSDLAALMQAVA
ncbi:MAG: FMN-binding negative transcriptional regulator [Sphingomicrobium sp.]